MARLNRLEAGVVAFGEIVHPEVRLAQRLGDSDLDWVWFGTEHAPPDFSLLADCLQYMVSRPRMRLTGEAVTGPAPMIGLPPGAATTSRWMVGLALDCGCMALHQARVQTSEDCSTWSAPPATRTASAARAYPDRAGMARWARPATGAAPRSTSTWSGPTSGRSTPTASFSCS